jgi:alpha-amylase/alpha-mannosidase (GH57 family)
MMKNKYVCIHGHYYQPPRENAWLEVIERQESAKPFHDWNERINYECYATNATARILDERGFIRKIINNYAKISFNIGPTLMSWLEENDPQSYQLVLEADQLAQRQFEGHGSAIAQVYSHLIMPLANRRDKITQVAWGLKDFEKRFGRKSEGIWLAETAVDTETLEILADFDIKYTVLAPRQAKAFRKIGDDNWIAGINTQRPYWCFLPSGKKIALFFYDGDIAQDVAFKGLLNSGKAFAHRFKNAFDDTDNLQLAHIATDGESYGHHHRFGEMALADCINVIEKSDFAEVINYGAFLAKFPPTHEAQIHENSSWSCVHGIERWRSDCGCNSGRAGWHQRWRAPLRAALDWLREQLIPLYETAATPYLKDCWEARDAYIDVILNRKEANIEHFLQANSKKTLSQAEKVFVLRLMEMQRNTVLMYTSCGWFFDEISGLETNQILQYACRAIDYATQINGVDLHKAFEEKLTFIPSNVYENGAVSYKKYVLPSRVNLERTGMHYAAASLFEKFPQHLELFNYTCTSQNFERIIAGGQRLVLGETIIKSKITYSEKDFYFAALYLGQHNIIGSISTEMDNDTFELMKTQIKTAFRDTNLGEVINIMQTFFGMEKYTLYDLFHDEKIVILNQIAEKSLSEAETAFRNIYEDNYQLMSSMQTNDLAIPEAYKTAVSYIINHDLEKYFTQDYLSIRELQRLFKELEKWHITLSDASSFSHTASERLFSEVKKIDASESSLSQIIRINNILTILEKQNIKLDIWKSQKIFYHAIKDYKENNWVFANDAWKTAFLNLGQLLKVDVE